VEKRIRLLVWTQALLLDGELATAEPKKLRYRLLRAAARITRGGRRLCLRISATWRWRHERWSRSHTGLSSPRGAHVFEEGRQELASVVLVRGPCRRRDR